MIFGGKQRAVESLIAQYLEQVTDCLDAFADCIQASLEGQAFEDLVQKVERTHQAESKADDLRREVAMMLYGKALFPESRGDILGLLEAVDRVPNKAESVVRQMQHQRFAMPSDLSEGFGHLACCVKDCGTELIRAVAELFENYSNAMFLAEKVNELESQADDAELALIEKIFTSSRETGDKILLRDMAQAIGGVADRAEDASDRIRIIAVKRKV